MRSDGFRCWVRHLGVAFASATVVLAQDPPSYKFKFLQPYGVLSEHPEVGSLPGVPDTRAAPSLETNQFLFTGPNPIQRGVQPGALRPERFALVRGRVLRPDGTPCPGAAITVVDHPELGQTTSRSQGGVYMGVNGGDPILVRFTMPGCLPVERCIRPGLNATCAFGDVVMTQIDANVTAMDTTQPRAFTVHRGARVVDQDGARQATLLMPQGAVATMLLPNGSRVALQQFRVRATEFTVGGLGPQAMPAMLPATSAYTYCAAFTIDEALQAGAVRTSFDKPPINYLENFLKLPVGVQVPLGYYDPQTHVWQANPNGLVLKILAINGGLADLDLDGSGQVASSQLLAQWGITGAERQQIAALYGVGQELWRTVMPHFCCWDSNMGIWPPPGAGPPGGPPPGPGGPPPGPPGGPGPCQGAGSVIRFQDQTLGKVVDVAATPYRLHYLSGRMPGDLRNLTLHIPLSGATIPPPLQRIHLDVQIAGRSIQNTFPPAPNLLQTFQWDGQDAYGRYLTGQQPVLVRIGYGYQPVYSAPPNAGQFGSRGNGIPISVNGRSEIVLWQEHNTTLSAYFNPNVIGFGGWSLDVVHSYDPGGGTIYLGDGRTYTAASMTFEIKTAGGLGSMGGDGDGGPATAARIQADGGICTAGDGSIYFADTNNHRVRKIDALGIITTVAGTGVPGYDGDGRPATQSRLYHPMDVKLGADGSLYIADSYNHRVRRVAADGRISTLAGIGIWASFGDGGPAAAAAVKLPTSVAVGLDGTVYLADVADHRVRAVYPDGRIEGIAGTGIPGFSGEGGQATQAMLAGPTGVAVGPGDELYIADFFNHRVRRVTTNGLIATIAGNGVPGFSGDGGQATSAQFNGPLQVALDSDGTLLVVDCMNHAIRAVRSDGLILTASGTGAKSGYAGDGGPARTAQLNLPSGVAATPDHGHVVVDSGNYRIRRVAGPMPGFGPSNIAIPSEDGSELYQFDANGRHLSTVSTRFFDAAGTPVPLYAFQYDAQGFLTQVKDRDGNVTTIGRDTRGVPYEIVGPYGQKTGLELGSDGFLSRITDPLGNSDQFVYWPGGLLKDYTDRRGNVWSYQYDNAGRLVRAADPEGGDRQLAYAPLLGKNGFTVTVTTKQTSTVSEVSTYQVEYLPGGAMRQTNTGACCVQAQLDFDGVGSIQASSPNGNILLVGRTADPRFGTRAPQLARDLRTTPGGKQRTQAQSRAITTAPTSPLRILTETQTLTVNSQTWTEVFDAIAFSSTRTSPEGRSSVLAYDPVGRLLSLSLPDAGVSRFTYDISGRVKDAQQGPAGSALVTRYQYQQAGQGEGFLSQIGWPNGRRTDYVRDSAGRVLQEVVTEIGGVSLTIAYTYDASGRVASITPPGRPGHQFDYDQSGRLAKYRPPAPGTGNWDSSFAYDLAGRLLAIQEPGVSLVRHGYDSSGRRTSTTVARGAYSYAYDSRTGLMTRAAAPGGVAIDLTYDGDELTSAVWSGNVAGSVQLKYDNNLRLADTLVNGSLAAPRAYDKDGDLAMVGSLRLQRDGATGAITDEFLGGVHLRRSYDVFRELTMIAADYNGQTLWAESYQRDVEGRIVQKTESRSGTQNTVDYRYDGFGQLLAVAVNGVPLESYAYDVSGNRIWVTRGGSTTRATFDVQDRLITDGASTYAYLPSGELASRTSGGQMTAYSHDELGNLLSVTLPGLKQVAYILDGQNRRVGRQVNGALVGGYLYESDLRIAAELDGAGRILARFAFAEHPSAPAYMVKGSTIYRYVTDGLGSVRMVLDATSGAIAQEIDYGPWGDTLKDTNPGFQPFGFAGGLVDADTGLIRFGTRDYDPLTGRWTSKDSIGFGGGDHNLYRYVKNDPINDLDPTGLFPTLRGIREWVCDRLPSPHSPQASGCDVVSLIPGKFKDACTRACCKEHDECYERNECNAASWLPICPDPRECKKCNRDVAKCILRCDAARAKGQ